MKYTVIYRNRPVFETNDIKEAHVEMDKVADGAIIKYSEEACKEFQAKHAPLMGEAG